MQEFIDIALSQLGNLIQTSTWFTPVIALVAGILTSVTPCSLSTIPLVVGYVGGTEVSQNNPKKAFLISLTFAGGMAITFTLLGTIASIAGNLIGSSSRWWYIFLGLLMVLMALQTWEVIHLIPSTYLQGKNKRKGYLGAFITGLLGGLFSSPCATPVLIALLTIVAGKGNLLWGIVLLLFYSLGHGFLIVVTGTSIGFVKKLSKNNKMSVFTVIIKILLGFLILLVGLYMFWLGF
jgi:cytochrome c biogenesis protein CcdA